MGSEMCIRDSLWGVLQLWLWSFRKPLAQEQIYLNILCCAFPSVILELFAEASSWAGMGVQAALVLLCWSADRLAPGTLGYVDAASDPYGAAESG